MAFTARAETYARGSSLTSPFNFTINKATSVADGDIMFMYLATYVATPPTVDSVPSGWEFICSAATSSSSWFLYYKIASGEGTNYTWSLNKSCRYYALNIAYTSGDFDVTSISDITAISNTLYATAGTVVRAASMNVPDLNSPLVYFGAVYSKTVRTFTKPSVPTTDWVEDADQGHTTPDISLTNGSMIWSSNGDTGDMDITCSASITTQKHAFAIALKPSPPPSPSVTPSISFSQTPTITPSVSFSQTPTITPSISFSRTPSITPSISFSRTPSVTPSVSFSQSPSFTPSISLSRTPSITPSISISQTPTITPSISFSRTPSITPSISFSQTPTRTPSVSFSRTPSITPSISISISFTPSRTPTLTPTESQGTIHSHWGVKYSTISVPNTIKNKNMVFGYHGDADFGPTEITGFWNGIDPPIGGYTIYHVTASRQEPSIHIAHNDAECINFARLFGGVGINTIGDAITYFSTINPDTNIFNSSGIIT